ncbi:hypothetical protein [Streptomyces sp. NPDC006784]|uniref:hypothetical protein n=1 Tax=Streptomyces sp. NPDC006784 TaxID=3364764 RepID=UPI0036932821
MTEHKRRLARSLSLLLALFFCFASGTMGAPAALAAEDPPGTHADYGPKDGKTPPPEYSVPGIDGDGNYCELKDGVNDCRPPKRHEIPGRLEPCEGVDGNGSLDCSKEDRKDYERDELKDWRKANQGDLPRFDEKNKYNTKCVEDGTPFSICRQKAEDKYRSGISEWVSGKISELASDALKEAANYIGKSVVWLLDAFSGIFLKASTIDLGDTGIGKVVGISTALSAVLATFLLLLQFGKVSLSHKGEPAATAIAGLAKWAVISSVYYIAVTTALKWSDAVSEWMITYSFSNGGADANATDLMQQQLGKMFSGLISGGVSGSAVGTALISGTTVSSAAVGVIIVIGIVCLLAIGALWIEVLLRQAGIMIIMATMPITLAGQLSDSTQEWWTKARNALIALILMKPMIVMCFSIGFFAMSNGKGVQNMIVGLVIFLLACFAWPVLAKFMTFSTNGAGSSAASGLISSIGSSASSTSGRPDMSGAGAVGGGTGYTRALEQDTAQTAAGGSNAAATAGKGRFGPSMPTKAGVLGSVGGALQLMAMGKDMLESAAANTAAHAGLDQAQPGGRHVAVPRQRDTPQETPPPTPDNNSQNNPDSQDKQPSPIQETPPPPQSAAAPPPPPNEVT